MTSVQTEPRVPSDAELITSSRAGDEIAYAALYERHVSAARAAARALTRSHVDSDDLVAEAFTRVLQALRRGGGPEVAFRPYLLTSVRNAFYDRAKRARREEITDEQDDVPSLFGVDDLAGEDQKLVAAAFAQLPERWQLVLWHTEVEGKNPSEVAPLLGLAPNAVAALAYRAREGLRQAYLQAHLQRQVPERCRPFADKLGAYARDGLAARDRRKVAEHLAECERCTTLLAELGEVNHNLKGVLVPILLGVPAAAYLSGLGGKSALLYRFRPRLPKNPALTMVAAGVAASVVAVAGFAFLRPDHTSNSSAPSTTVVAVAAPRSTVGGSTTTVTVPANTTVPESPTSAPVAVIPPATTTTTARVGVTAGATPPRVTTSPTSSATTTTTTTPEPDTTTATTATPAADTSATVPTTAPTVPTTPPAVTTTTTTVPAPPTFTYTVDGDFVGPVVEGGVAGLQVDLTVAAAPGSVGKSRWSGMFRALAPATTQVHMTLSDNVTFSGIDAGWTCEKLVNDVVCNSTSLERAGNSTILVRVGVSPIVPPSTSASASIVFQIVTPDSSKGFTAVKAVTAAATLGNPVFAAVDHGDIALAGNTLMTCGSSNLCADTEAGIGSMDNNNWNMQYAHIDDVAAPFNSSESMLILPDKAQILYAGLRWSGDAAQAVPPVVPDVRRRVLFTDPYGTTTTITDGTVVALDSSRFISMKDVTSLVQSGGAGSYIVADVAASTGTDKYAGWALVVAYRSLRSPTQMLLVRDTSDTDTWTIPRVKPLKPLSVTVAGLPRVTSSRPATIAVVAFEGDRGLTGDTLTANGLQLSNCHNPLNNIFNSSIVLGSCDPSVPPPPPPPNTLGIDIDRFDEKSVPADGVDNTTVTFTFGSGDDRVYLATIVLVVDLEAP